MKAIAASLTAILAAGVLGIGGVGDGLGAEPGAVSGADLAGQVLAQPSIQLRPAARSDIERGLVDPRILQILLLAAGRHTLSSVGPLVSGHSYYVAGTDRPSNHAFGRAVDIPVVDGEAVSVANLPALELTRFLGALAPPLRPDELGAPWKLDFGGLSTFTKNHGDHIHVGFRTKA